MKKSVIAFLVLSSTYLLSSAAALAVRQTGTSPIQTICNQLKQVIEQPSAQGVHQALQLFAQLHALDSGISSHYYQIFERAYRQVPVNQQNAAHNLIPAAVNGRTEGAAPATALPSASADQQEEIRQLRIANYDLHCQLAEQQLRLGRPPAAEAPDQHQNTQAQQNRITELQTQLRQANERTDREHHLMHLLNQFAQDQTGGQLTQTAATNIINQYSQILRDLGFDIEPMMRQLRNNPDAMQTNMANLFQIADPAVRFFAVNHPLLQTIQQMQAIEQMEREQANEPQQDDPPDNTPLPAAPAPSAPPLRETATDQQNLPSTVRRIPREAIVPHPPRIRPDHSAIDMPEPDKTQKGGKSCLTEQTQSLIQRTWNAVTGLPRATAQGIANVFNGLLDCWNADNACEHQE